MPKNRSKQRENKRKQQNSQANYAMSLPAKKKG